MPDTQVKITLKRHYLNSGGYDKYGCYYGVDQPLYDYAADIELEGGKWETFTGELRANGREHAKALVLNRFKLEWPNHTGMFYN